MEVMFICFFLYCCSGIGIVNAIEVINAFPEENGLRQFREWIESPDPDILGKVDFPARSNLEKTASKAEDCSKSSLNCSSEGALDGPVDDLLKMKQQFMKKHVNFRFIISLRYLLLEDPLYAVLILFCCSEESEQKLAYSFYFPKRSSDFSI